MRSLSPTPKCRGISEYVRAEFANIPFRRCRGQEISDHRGKDNVARGGIHGYLNDSCHISQEFRYEEMVKNQQGKLYKNLQQLFKKCFTWWRLKPLKRFVASTARQGITWPIYRGISLHFKPLTMSIQNDRPYRKSFGCIGK